MTTTLKIGERVKLTQRAFDNGVYEATKVNRAKRGTVAHQCHSPQNVSVLWDGRKSAERLWHEFVNRAET